MFINITCKNITNNKQEPFKGENEINQKVQLKTPLILSNQLEPQREEFEKAVISALERIRIFAKQYNWENLTTESFMDSIMIFDTKQGFDTTLLILVGADKNMELPKSYSACLENKILLSVSPEIYNKNYPEGNEDKYFEKLLTHEIAHRLHIRY
ncbi:MAG: hypothetical protein A2046_06830 [Bacteroidetes bacterium GWA2_30_7]|nr:MAG: hypothetical protein A2046_06830 [Bacteroidetes bacterium GWA2_30_7]